MTEIPATTLQIAARALWETEFQTYEECSHSVSEMPRLAQVALQAAFPALRRGIAEEATRDLRKELRDLQKESAEFVNELLEHAPRCWDGDEAAESIALDYLRHLEDPTRTSGAHRPHCSGEC